VSAVGQVLRLPTYQRFLAGAVCSGIGVWIFQTAIYWAALQSGSTGSVGALVAVLSLPSLLLTIPAGYLTDRAGPYWLLLVGAIAPAVACVGGIALVSPDGTIALEPAAVVTFVVGSAYALWNVPALVYVTRTVPGPVMGTAISMMVLQYATGRIIGGALGGWLVGVGGAALAFGVSAIVFGVGAIVALSLPRISGLDSRSGSTLRGMAEALGWLRHAPATLVLVVFGATTSMLAYAYIPLLGALSRDVIHAGATGLGTLTSTSGIGMVASAVTANALGGRLRRGRAVVLLILLGAVFMAALGVSSVLVLSVALVIVVAYIGSGRSSISAYLLQSLTPPRMRGRVSSLADFIGQLMTIIGSIAIGALAVSYGPTAVLVGASAIIVSVVLVVVIVAPWFLGLDVDAESRAVLRDEPYVEGRVGAGAIAEPS
jgi:MFS family permease